MQVAIASAAAYSLGAMGLVASAVGLKARLELLQAKHVLSVRRGTDL